MQKILLLGDEAIAQGALDALKAGREFTENLH